MDLSWMEHPVVKKMDPRKQDILKTVVKNGNTKNMNQAMPILMNAYQQLAAQNLAFTSEESDVMMDLLTRDMSANDKSKFEAMKQMMKNYTGTSFRK